MIPASGITPPVAADEIATPERQPGFIAGLLSGPALPAFAARWGARLAARRGRPWRIGSTVIAARHADVTELLSRDLDFRIAPVNATRMDEVNGPFVLGMDRDARLAAEREALYRALAAVDLAPLRASVAAEIVARVDVPALDLVADYARPIAARTARRLFGLETIDEAPFADAARAIFGHTFLNLGGDAVVRARAVRAAALMRGWLAAEIDRRRGLARDTLPDDMMSALLRQGALDDDGVRRTLGGMIVGSVDTTASTVAKIVAVLGRDPKLHARVAADTDDEGAMHGWCLDLLRRWPHNPILLRRAERATSLGGTALQAGDRVVAWTQAAMLDPAVFVEPARMRPDRPAAGYLHFGGLLHGCAGRRINGFQVPMLVAGLLRRNVATVGRIGWAGPFPAHLPVRFA